MGIFIFCCWYLSGIVALSLFAKRTKRKKREDFGLLILAGLLGPFGFIIGLLLRNTSNNQPERYQSRDLPS